MPYNGRLSLSQAVSGPPTSYQQPLDGHDSSEYAPHSTASETDNDNYVHHVLTGISFKCCGCEGYSQDDWQALNSISAAPSGQRDLSALTCEKCARAPCSKCTFSLSYSGVGIVTPKRLLVPFEPLDRRLYIFLCDLCGRAKEIYGEQEQPQTVVSVPLPRGRRLSFSRNGTIHDTKFYANLDEAECHDCNHKACKNCVFFDAPNRWGSGKGGRLARRSSRAGSIVKALTSATIISPNTETENRSSSRRGRRGTLPSPSKSTPLNHIPQHPTRARTRNSSRLPSPSPAGSRDTSKQPSSGLTSAQGLAPNFQGTGPDLDMGAALHRVETDEEKTRGKRVCQPSRHDRQRASTPKLVPLHGQREDWIKPPSDKEISPIDPDWKDDGIKRKVSILMTNPDKRWPTSER